MATKRKRAYTKSARAESEAETRSRIVDAVVALHEEIGPLRTTVKGIAERAGVQRLTVYRHFANDRELIAACSARWSELLPPPDLSSIAAATPRRRARELLIALYRYYRAGERMLTNVHSDAERLPVVAAHLAPFDAYLDRLATVIGRAWQGNSARRRTTVRHAVQFTTWRSLAALTEDDVEAAELVLGWLDSLSPARGRALG